MPIDHAYKSKTWPNSPGHVVTLKLIHGAPPVSNTGCLRMHALFCSSLPVKHLHVPKGHQNVAQTDFCYLRRTRTDEADVVNVDRQKSAEKPFSAGFSLLTGPDSAYSSRKPAEIAFSAGFRDEIP
ncbi:hypothetical protein DFH28DRAFT_1127571 [Melampsora americana]|nr:hypothetical protein DFH28DRAFT_1127571 [Melampsora americana]